MMLKRATGDKPDNIAKAMSGAPIGRFAKMDEIAKAVTWIASDEASYMVGAVVEMAVKPLIRF